MVVTFTDKNLSEGLIDWGDGTSGNGVINEGILTATHAYTNPGIYPLSITLTDICQLQATASDYNIIVYDPGSPCLTGGGWIISPGKACHEQGGKEGKGTFGMEVGYSKGHGFFQTSLAYPRAGQEG